MIFSLGYITWGRKTTYHLIFFLPKWKEGGSSNRSRSLWQQIILENWLVMCQSLVLESSTEGYWGDSGCFHGAVSLNTPFYSQRYGCSPDQGQVKLTRPGWLHFSLQTPSNLITITFCHMNFVSPIGFTFSYELSFFKCLPLQRAFRKVGYSD